MADRCRMPCIARCVLKAKIRRSFGFNIKEAITACVVAEDQKTVSAFAELTSRQ